MEFQRSRGATRARILLALGATAAVALLIGTTVALTRTARSLHVAEDEGPGRVGSRFLPTRSRVLSPRDPGALVDPFTVGVSRATKRGWVLLDLSSREVLLVSPEGREEGRMGRHGQGPGELEYPAIAARGGDGTVAVADAFTRHLDLFPTSGDPWRWRIRAGDCDTGTPIGLWESPAGGWRLVRTCVTGLRRSLELVHLETGQPQVDSTLGRLPTVVQDLFAQPLAVVMDGRLLVGSTRHTCLSEAPLGQGSGSEGYRCLPSPRPFETPDSLLQERIGGSLGRLAAAGLKFTLPDEMPTLADVRETSRGPALRIVLEDLSEAWAFEEEGELVYAELPDGVRAYPGWDAWLLLADELDGLRIWTLPYADWTDGD